jgi:hypothetical protein
MQTVVVPHLDAEVRRYRDVDGIDGAKYLTSIGRNDR